jgi:predicted transcriptional regulator
VLRLRESGISVRGIAVEVGKSVNTVQRMLKAEAAA